jgi:hypothetical protein
MIYLPFYMNINDIILDLSTNTKYSHAVFGCFGVIKGHDVKAQKGPLSLKKYIINEMPYDILFRGEESSPEFMAKIFTDIEPEGRRLILIFNDRKGDSRSASHTDYHILLPHDTIASYKNAIITSPELLISVFQKVFPEYDRSNGRLRMHPEFRMINF